MDSPIETTLLEITGKIYILVFISFIIELLDLCLDISGEISANRSTGIDIDVEASPKGLFSPNNSWSRKLLEAMRPRR